MERDHFFQSPEISYRWGFQGIRKEKTSCEIIFIDIPEASPIAYFKILVPSSQNSHITNIITAGGLFLIFIVSILFISVAIATEVLRGWKTAIT